ncbi:DUF5134 domain-containing protein [Amycolatopsis carbonis]|uniref:DUF5134 domain-containing protein n=1 Tax=Amycolatopsis carbonis TaxID=715471 RepID=A0A9Y2IHI7_9PSEU|nr:DUF5134 domain-containing protein [Amycolatopsis sp. 2-15]WIX79260.1 DUF5134 domain-containing protein [Amycolatopsis sp. 2-15]
MIQDLVVRWVVTALFALCATERVHGIAVGRLPWRGVVVHSLHALMALAMALMAWPRGADLPTTGPLVLFLLAAVWFTAVAARTAEHRRSSSYHALMMLAMAWMYALMTDGLLPAPVSVTGAGSDHGSSMPAMHMPGMPMSVVSVVEAPAGTPPLVTMLNWVLTIGSAVAGAWWLSELLARRRTKPPASGRAQLTIATQALMAAGMATMFAAMM